MRSNAGFVNGLGERLRRLALTLRGPGEGRFIFVLSHMRSYSSLLSHILGSHDQVTGHSESRIAYDSRRDLALLRDDLARKLGRQGTDYALDKVLHDKYRVLNAILSHPDTRPIFLVREPCAAIASIVRVHKGLDASGRYTDPAFAAAYYTSRLETLVSAARCCDHALFIRSESILSDPDTVLEFLAAALELRAPLDPAYRVFEDTGTVGLGDPSEHIRAGHIVEQPAPSDEVRIPPGERARAEDAYESSCGVLEQLCRIP